jgi:L-alanine-DL-glutamate epimerase-like enolase superfamily enzyme
MSDHRPVVDRLDTAAYRVPTDEPESDGTLCWDSTTVVVVTAHAGDTIGLGSTYCGAAVESVVRDELAPVVSGRSALEVGGAWAAMVDAVRNLGWPGLVSCAISAVDVALWDLKARLLGLPVSVALGRVADGVEVYGSGGFCSYDDQTLANQLSGWVEQGMSRVKIKVGRDPGQDRHRLAVAGDALGGAARLMVDANGAYERKQALAWADIAAGAGVVWLEEPASSDDHEGLRLLRDRGPAGVDIAAGEYGYHLPYFHHLLDAGAVDCLQADVTRCGGFTGFGAVAALCQARSMDLSAHCAPQLSAHAGVAAPRVRHLEYFHDHVRLEALLFDGVLEPVDGVLRPERDRPGTGLELRAADAERYRI